MTTFPIARKRGYDIDDVETFLAKARAAYDGQPGAELGAEDIRSTGFALRRRGYQTQAVDAALERLEDAFAAREHELARLSVGDDAYSRQISRLTDEIEEHLRRDDRHRFSRVSVFSQGYRMRDVDAFAGSILGYLGHGELLSLAQVRSVVFGAQRGGYREEQVDALLDAVTEAMLAIR